MTARPASNAALAPETLDALVAGRFADPFGLLGPHHDPHRDAVVVRVFQPAARDVTLHLVHPSTASVRMERIQEAGLFEAVVPGATSASGIDYRKERALRSDRTRPESAGSFSTR